MIDYAERQKLLSKLDLLDFRVHYPVHVFCSYFHSLVYDEYSFVTA